MGKQVKYQFIDEETTPAPEKKVNYEFIDDEPVKKKELTEPAATGGEDSSTASAPGLKPSGKNTPLKIELPDQNKTPEQVNYEYREKKRRESNLMRLVTQGSQQELESNPIITAGKTFWNTLRHNVGPDLVQFGSLLTPDYPVMIAPGANIDTKGYHKERRAVKAEVVKWNNEQKALGAKFSEDVVNSMDKIEDPIDALNYVTSAVTQGGSQIVPAVLSFGTSAIGQEVGSIYLESVNQIAKDKGISPEDVITSGQDKPAIALAGGIAAGAIDYLSASKVFKAFKPNAFAGSLRKKGIETLKSGATEFITEDVQTGIEQYSKEISRPGVTAGQAFEKVLTDPEYAKERKEAATQGFLGGSGTHAIGQVMSKSPAEVIAEQKSTIASTSDVKSAEQAADLIQQRINAPEGDLGVQPSNQQVQPTTPPQDLQIEPEEVRRQMKPFAEKMVGIEREFENAGLEISPDYDNQTIVTNKKTGEIVEPEDLPEHLKEKAGQYEQATSKLGEYSDADLNKTLQEVRNDTKDVKHEEVTTALPQKLSKPKKVKDDATFGQWLEANYGVTKDQLSADQIAKLLPLWDSGPPASTKKDKPNTEEEAPTSNQKLLQDYENGDLSVYDLIDEIQGNSENLHPDIRDAIYKWQNQMHESESVWGQRDDQEQYEKEFINAFKKVVAAESKPTELTRDETWAEKLTKELPKTVEPHEKIAKQYHDEARSLKSISPEDKAISEHIGKVTAESVRRFGDKNHISRQMARAYLSKDGFTIDQVAQDAGVTPDQVWEFMKKYPGGPHSVSTPSGNQRLAELNDQYKKLTGKNLNQKTAKAIADKINSDIGTEQANNELQGLLDQNNEVDNEKVLLELERDPDAFKAKYGLTDEDLHYLGNELYGKNRQRDEGQRKAGRTDQQGQGQPSQGGPLSSEFGDQTQDPAQQAAEIAGKNLTHVPGLNMGKGLSEGTYVSTESQNRYGEGQPVTVSVQKPFVFKSENGIIPLRNKVLNDRFDEFGPEDFEGDPFSDKKTIEGLTEKGIDKLAGMVREEMQKEGFDSIYLPESETQEGELVVFDRDKVKFAEKPKAYKAQGIPEKEADIRAIEDQQQMALQVIQDSIDQTGENAPPASEPPPGQGNTPPSPPEAPEPPNEAKNRKKALLNRAYEGTDQDGLKDAIEKHGLDYEIEVQTEAAAAAEAFINEVGLDAALDAVRQNLVKGGMAAFVWSKIIDHVGEQFATAESQEEIDHLNELEAGLLEEFGRQAKEGGQFNSALNRVYATSDFGYKASEQIKAYKEKNNGEIDPDTEQRFREIEEKLKEANKRIEELEKAKAEQSEKDLFGAILQDAKKEKRPGRRKGKELIKEGLSDLIDVLNSGKLYAIADPEQEAKRMLAGHRKIVRALEKIGRGLIDEGIATIENVADKLKEYIDTQFKGKMNFETYRQDVVAAIKNVTLPKVTKEGKLTMPNSFLKDLILNGADTIEKLTAEVMKVVKPMFPDITERQVRDAITKYGRTLNMSKEAIDVKLRELKTLGRLLSGEEDVSEGKRPQRSGLQRDKPSDEVRRRQRDLKERMKELPLSAEEEERTWRTALDATKARLQNQIKDLEEQIATGKKTPKKAGIEYDAEAKALAERRDALRQVIRDLEGKPQMSDEQKVRMAVAAAENSLKEYERRIREKDFGKQAQRGTPLTQELIEARKRRDEARAQYEALKQIEGVADQQRLDAAKEAVRKSIAEYQRRIQEGDFTKKKKTEIEADDELTQLRADKLALKHQADKLQYENELKNRTKTQKVIDGVLEAWGITRALRATGEFSFIMIQGGVQTLAHPIYAWQAFRRALLHFRNPQAQQDWFNKIKTQEWYSRASAARLAITEPNARLSAREEQFLGGWVNKIWDVAGLPIKAVSQKAYEKWKAINLFSAIERAGIAYLDTLRIMRYLDGEEMLRNQGKTFRSNPDDFKNMADVINTFTGRASLGKLEPMSGVLSAVFFSPRNWMSMLKQATPYAFYHFGKMTSGGKVSVAQKMALGDYMKFVGSTGAILALVAASSSGDDDDWQIEFDPRSSDFLKLRRGNTRVDPWGGRIQMIVLQARLIMQSIKDQKGQIKQLGDGQTSTMAELILNMAKNKLAPSAAILDKYLESHVNKSGERVNKFGQPVSVVELLKENMYPIFWDSIIELHNDQPETLAYFLDIMALIGVGTQTYSKPVQKERDEIGDLKKDIREPLKDLRQMKQDIRKSIR